MAVRKYKVSLTATGKLDHWLVSAGWPRRVVVCCSREQFKGTIKYRAGERLRFQCERCQYLYDCADPTNLSQGELSWN